MKKYIEFGENHTTVIGKTRMGKTAGVLNSLMKVSSGVIFMNTNNTPFPRGWTRADMHTDLDHILDGLIAGEKIVYHPDPAYREQEMSVLSAFLFRHSQGQKEILDIYIVVDEVHLYRKQGLSACVNISTTGLAWGLKAIWISQRPQKIPNDLMSQSTLFVFYKTFYEKESYFSDYGIPYDQINDKIPGKYYYCTFDGEKVEGPFIVPI